MIDTIEFKVGDKYENMKGPYEVISVKGDSMVIRWENGEEISTEIDLQQRILERIDRENRMREAARKKKAAKPQKARSAASRYGNKFNGFEEGDFKKNITGTNWRSRSCLGGAVTEKLPKDKYSFNSWAVYRKPVIHWADVAHRDRGDSSLQAKFFAEVDDERLWYGLLLESPEDAGGVEHDYAAFLDWLKDPENEKWMCRTAAENNIAIYDIEERGFKGTIRAEADQWQIHHPDGREDIDSLCTFLDALPGDRGVALNIARIEPKANVLKKETAISEDISGLFEVLMPLYEAATPDNA
jgi:hypothetical protein